MRRNLNIFEPLIFLSLIRKVRKDAVIEYKYFSGRRNSGTVIDVLKEKYDAFGLHKISTVAVLEDGKRIRFVDANNIMVESDIENEVEKFNLDKVWVK